MMAAASELILVWSVVSLSPTNPLAVLDRHHVEYSRIAGVSEESLVRLVKSDAANCFSFYPARPRLKTSESQTNSVELAIYTAKCDIVMSFLNGTISSIINWGSAPR